MNHRDTEDKLLSEQELADIRRHSESEYLGAKDGFSLAVWDVQKLLAHITSLELRHKHRLAEIEEKLDELINQFR